MIKISGTITKVFDTLTIKDFQKRLFWLEDKSDKYPNVFQLELWKSDCSMIDSYDTGDFVTIYLDLKGKHWSKDGKEGITNTLKCWNIEKDGVPFKEIK
jgi:hypothetical protein